jgi:hypothetical protein
MKSIKKLIQLCCIAWLSLIIISCKKSSVDLSGTYNLGLLQPFTLPNTGGQIKFDILAIGVYCPLNQNCGVFPPPMVTLNIIVSKTNKTVLLCTSGDCEQKGNSTIRYKGVSYQLKLDPAGSTSSATSTYKIVITR